MDKIILKIKEVVWERAFLLSKITRKDDNEDLANKCSLLCYIFKDS